MGNSDSIEEFKAFNCRSFESEEDGRILLSCDAGQDDFNIPGLHSASDIAYACREIEGDFTFSVSVTLLGREKFDAAGIYLITEHCRVKHGLEYYAENDYCIVTVHTSPLSDESNGMRSEAATVALMATRKDDTFSFYCLGGETICFNRAFALQETPQKVQLGLYVQSPFSNAGASATFADLKMDSTPFEHIRL